MSSTGTPGHRPASPPLRPEPGRPEPLRPEPLRPEPVWRDSQFWVLQLLILALALIRLAASVALHLDQASPANEFTTVALFLVPVVYASLNFGFRGAIVTSGWVTILAIPLFVAAVDGAEYSAAWAEVMQVGVLNVLAFLVGQRVSAERQASRVAESAREAHRAAEALYRDLFESNQAPILIVDAEGRVAESNASASRAFPVTQNASSKEPAERPRLVDVIGAEASRQVLLQLVSGRTEASQRPEPTDRPAADPADPVDFTIGDEHVIFRPTATVLADVAEGRRVQIVFEDVTLETRRHQRMEAYAARVIVGQEEERRHIAQELHDGPLQTLIHLCRQIDAVPASSPLNDPESPAIASLRSTVEGAVAELRDIARGLRPSILDDLGLVASINQMIAETGRRHHIESTFGVTGEVCRLAPPIELALFRIAQEALSNIERHAQAGRVAVGLNFEPHGVRLLVRDDGRGFALPSDNDSRRHESLGLPGMTERAHLVGARLSLTSAPGSGTTIDVWVPAKAQDGRT